MAIREMTSVLVAAPGPKPKRRPDDEGEKYIEQCLVGDPGWRVVAEDIPSNQGGETEDDRTFQIALGEIEKRRG